MKIPSHKPVILLFILLGIMGVLSFMPKADKPAFIEEETALASPMSKNEVGKVNLPGLKNNITYGNWVNYSLKDGLPSDKVFCVKADGDQIWAGTDAGLALFSDGKWTTYTDKDGLAHNGVLSLDISPVTGDLWVGTMGGLSKFSGGQFETYTQFNSGLANDIIYQVVCDGKDVWVATGGGASSYDTYSKEWRIFTQANSPMHEPWTYGISASSEKVFIAAWGGGVIEYNKTTGNFRDYVDPDGEMELDLFPDDGLVHDITTGVSYADDILWVATYFGLSRYDGVHWQGYFDDDSGLASNFINAVKANGAVVWLCTDNGVSSFDGDKWITYRAFENQTGGQVIAQQGSLIDTQTSQQSIAHNYVLGVDFMGDKVIFATSGGLSIGSPVKNGEQKILK
jgi:hypothetical protein